ncbi:hypothetical protein G6045_01640 [Streptomyces sp. YC504]|uniref:Uncharacterized protein n=1 Tax=Streptomyces mesophilus TaxID=1775132 RepID=A0A6G4XCL7_9ACTN|nr:hypothetical protein [Streptomyces mesophilus]NGO74391.1 hypothetical protein [Streptomyces mesophilus]
MDAGVSKVGELLGSLSGPREVYVRSGIGTAADLPSEIYALARTAQEEWAAHADERIAAPSPAEVAAALQVVGPGWSAGLLASLATESLARPGEALQDQRHARQVAVQVAGRLGNEATWMTNLKLSPGPPRRVTSSPVTRHTFDGVIAGANGGCFVVLLQVGED